MTRLALLCVITIMLLGGTAAVDFAVLTPPDDPDTTGITAPTILTTAETIGSALLAGGRTAAV